MCVNVDHLVWCVVCTPVFVFFHCLLLPLLLQFAFYFLQLTSIFFFVVFSYNYYYECLFFVRTQINKTLMSRLSEFTMYDVLYERIYLPIHMYLRTYVCTHIYPSVCVRTYSGTCCSKFVPQRGHKNQYLLSEMLTVRVGLCT